MKKALIGGGVVLAVILTAVASLPFLVDVNYFRPQIQSALESNLKRKVELGKLGLKWYPLSVSVDDVKVSEAAGWGTGLPFLVAKQILVNVDLASLLNKQVKVDALTVTQPAVQLIRNEQGKWNFQSIGQQGESSGKSNISFTQLLIDDATVTLIRPGATAQTFNHVKLALHDFVPGKPSKVEASMQLAGMGKQLVELNGTLNGGFDGNFKLTGVTQASFKGIDASGTVKAPASGPILFDATLSAADPILSGQFQGSVESGEALKGSLTARNLQVNRKEWKHPVQVASLKVALADDKAVFQPFVVQSGDFRADAKLEVSDISKTPAVNGEIDSSGTIAQMLTTASAFGADVSSVKASGRISLQAAFNGPTSKPDSFTYRASGALDDATVTVAGLANPLQLKHASFHVTPQLIDVAVDTPELSLLPSPATNEKATGKDGATSIRQAIRGTAKIGKLITPNFTFEQVKTQFSLSQGLLKMDPLEGTLFGGVISAAINSNLRQQPVQVNVATKLSGIDAIQLLGAATGLKKLLSGKLSADGGFSFNLDPNQPLAKSINGNLKIELLDGRINGFNLLNEFAKIGKFLGFSMKENAFTDFVRLAGSMKIQNGIAESDNIRLEFAGGSLGAAGTLNLLDEQMNMKLITTLDKNLSNLAGGNQIGGFLTTALANEKGELILPILASGLISKPRLIPDAGQIARMRLQSPAGLGKQVKDIQNAADEIKGFFDQFRKKKE